MPGTTRLGLFALDLDVSRGAPARDSAAALNARCRPPRRRAPVGDRDRGLLPCPVVSAPNLFEDCSPPDTGERLDVLLTHKNLVVERIVSSANLAPKRYVQSQDEWVVLV